MSDKMKRKLRGGSSHRNGQGGGHHVYRSSGNVEFANGACSKQNTSKISAVPAKLSIPGYQSTSETDVLKFLTYSLDSSYPDCGRVGKHSKVDFKSKEHGYDSAMISTSAEEKPTLNILHHGLDLEERPPMWCCYTKLWDSRQFAHGLSSNFSSPKMFFEDNRLVGKVDFISDWNNIKALLKFSSTDNHLSYLLHRVGNSVTVDHLDLLGVQLFPGFQQLPLEFVEFTRKIIGENAKAIINEGKSDGVVLGKEAFHKVLHFSMKEPLKLKAPESEIISGVEMQNNFLHRVMLSTQKFKILAGTNIPTFTRADSDAFEDATVRANDVNTSKSLRPLDAYDLWLDNTLMQCPSTLVSHYKDKIISKSEWIKTDELPAIGKFDLMKLLESGEKLLNFIKENVRSGHSYWLYRAPQSGEITLYNIANIQADGSSTPIFDKWEGLNNACFKVTSLLKYADLINEAVACKLPNESLNEPKPGLFSSSSKTVDKIGSTQKFNKLNAKIQSQSCIMEKHSKMGSWLIKSLDEISLASFDRIVNCIKGVYSFAVNLAPNMADCIYSHAVEKCFSMCSKLTRCFGLSGDIVNDNLAYNDSAESMRCCTLEVIAGLCEILCCITDWHCRVSLKYFDSSEWMYLGCWSNVINADLISFNTKKWLTHTRPPKLDEDLPANHYYKAIELYETALTKIPRAITFSVKRCFVPPASNNIISRNDLGDKVYWKLSTALFNAARFFLLYPSYVYHVESTAKENDSTSLTWEGRRSKKVNEVYGSIVSLLRQSIIAAQNVRKRHIITDDMIDKRIASANTAVGDIYRSKFFLDNLQLAPQMKLCEDYLDPSSGITDTMSAIEKFKMTKNALSGHPIETVVPNRSFVNEDAIPEAISYFSKVGQHYDKNGNIKKAIHGLDEIQQYLNAVNG